MGFFDFLKPIFGSETGVVSRKVTAPLTSVVAKDMKGPLDIVGASKNIVQNPGAFVSGVKGVYNAGIDPIRNIGSKIPGPVGGIVNKAVGAVLAPTDLGMSVLEKTAGGDLSDVKEIGEGLKKMVTK